MLSLEELRQVSANLDLQNMRGDKDIKLKYERIGYSGNETVDLVRPFMGYNEKLLMPRQNQLSTAIALDNLLSKYTVYDFVSGSLKTVEGQFQAGWFVAPTIKEIDEFISTHDKGILPKGKPKVSVKTGIDATELIVNGPANGIYQAASQSNALEMPNVTIKLEDGIANYPSDGTQGPAVAITAVPGTWVRNYWVTHKLKGPFNQFFELSLDNVNGYLTWGIDPETILNRLKGSGDKIRIPAMLYTQVAGVGKGRKEFVCKNKLVHQIYAASAPMNDYLNGGNDDEQIQIVRILLRKAYTGTIGIALCTKILDAPKGVPLDLPINLTLVGGGYFNNPLDVILEAIDDALKHFSGYDINVHIHVYRDVGGSTSNSIIQKLGHWMGYGPAPAAASSSPAAASLSPAVPVISGASKPGVEYIDFKDITYINKYSEEVAKIGVPVAEKLFNHSLKEPTPVSVLFRSLNKTYVPSELRRYTIHKPRDHLDEYLYIMDPYAYKKVAEYLKSGKDDPKGVLAIAGLRAIYEIYPAEIMSQRAGGFVQFIPAYNVPLLGITKIPHVGMKHPVGIMALENPNNILMHMQGADGKWTTYAPRDYQVSIANYIYQSNNSWGVIDDGQIKLYYFKYFENHPIIGYVNEAGKYVYIIDTNLHMHPSDPLRTFGSITQNPDGSYKLFNTRGKEYFEDDWITK